MRSNWVNEGDEVVLFGSIADAGEGDSHTAVVDWGDGVTSVASVAGGRLSAQHTYGDDGSYFARVCATDNDGAEGCDSVGVRVVNVAPSTPVSGNRSVGGQVGRPVAVSTEFTDPGRLDSHNAVIDWGDGLSTAASVGGLSVSGSHTYGAAGTYGVTVVVTDDDGGSTSYSTTVVVGASGGYWR